MSEYEQHWRGIGKLVEECGEVLQLLGKAMAFPATLHPDGAGDLRDRIPKEIADLKAAIEYFEQENDLSNLGNRQHEKITKFRKWGLPGVVDLQAKSYGK